MKGNVKAIALVGAVLILATGGYAFGQDGKINKPVEITVPAEPTDAEGWRQLGIEQAKRGELDAAMASHQKALKLYEAASNDDGMAAEYLALGFVYDRRGDFARAEEMLVKADKAAETSGDKDIKSFVYGSLGVFYKMKGDMAMAKACPPWSKARALFVERGHPQEVEQLDAVMGQFKCPAIAEPTDAEGWKQLGFQQIKRGEVDAAIASHQKALKLYEAAGNKKGMADEYSFLGVGYKDRGDLTRAEEMHTNALKLYEELHDGSMVTSYIFLSVVYEGRGDLARAVEVLVKAEKLVEGSGDKKLMATVYTSLGGASKMKGDMAIACPALRKARALYAELGEPQRVEEIADMARRAKCPAE